MDTTTRARILDRCRNREHRSILSQVLDLRAFGLLSPEAVIDLLDTAADPARYQARLLLERMSASVWRIVPAASADAAPGAGRGNTLVRFAIELAEGQRWQIGCRHLPALRVWQISR